MHRSLRAAASSDRADAERDRLLRGGSFQIYENSSARSSHADTQRFATDANRKDLHSDFANDRESSPNRRRAYAAISTQIALFAHNSQFAHHGHGPAGIRQSWKNSVCGFGWLQY